MAVVHHHRGVCEAARPLLPLQPAERGVPPGSCHSGPAYALHQDAISSSYLTTSSELAAIAALGELAVAVTDRVESFGW